MAPRWEVTLACRDSPSSGQMGRVAWPGSTETSGALGSPAALPLAWHAGAVFSPWKVHANRLASRIRVATPLLKTYTAGTHSAMGWALCMWQNGELGAEVREGGESQNGEK